MLCESCHGYTLLVRRGDVVCVPAAATDRRVQKVCKSCKVATRSAHPARFSPDDKFSRQRVTLKKRTFARRVPPSHLTTFFSFFFFSSGFRIHPTQQPAPEL